MMYFTKFYKVTKIFIFISFGIDMQIKSTNSINFKSHLTPQLIKKIDNVDVGAIEDAFKGNYAVDARFQTNKFLASCFALTLNIFENLAQKFNMPFQVLPPRIRVFSKSNTINSSFFSGNFCLPDSGYVLKDELPFELRSIFMENKSGILMNKETDLAFHKKQRSSSHFLSDVIH